MESKEAGKPKKDNGEEGIAEKKVERRSGFDKKRFEIFKKISKRYLKIRINAASLCFLKFLHVSIIVNFLLKKIKKKLFVITVSVQKNSYEILTSRDASP